MCLCPILEISDFLTRPSLVYMVELFIESFVYKDGIVMAEVHGLINASFISKKRLI